MVTLTLLEIVLGIDNVIFVSILVSRLKPEEQQHGRTIGMGLAMMMRICLLLTITWIMKLENPLFTVMAHAVSGRDIILIGGGLFLLGKSTFEIHHSMEGEDETSESKKHAQLLGILVQITVIDIVFSLDSVITAVGLAEHVQIMIAAVLVSVAIMMVFAKAIGDYIEKHPTLKVLALSFLILVAVTLLAEGCHFHISKGYIYFAMFFSMTVEMINIRIRSGRKRPVPLHNSARKP